MGAIAIVLWSTSVAFSRSLTESLGTLPTGAAVYTLAGLIACLYVWRQPGQFRPLLRLPRAYLLGCGALFVIYIIALYLAIGLSASRSQVVVVGLINYLWPALSLAFSVPLLGKRAGPGLLLGMALALAGIWLAAGAGLGISLQEALNDSAGIVPYVCALVAAVTWGLYSNLSRRWAGGAGSGAVPLFLLASGLLLALLSRVAPEPSAWTPGLVVLVLYMAIGPAMLAYVLWDASVRQGDITLVSSLSYFTPVLSSLISIAVLGVTAGLGFWLAVVLVMAGAVVCTWAVRDPLPAIEQTYLPR